MYMEKAKLFIAIDFDSQTKEVLSRRMMSLKKSGVTGNFTQRKNLHLTLAYIGETSRTAEVIQVIDKMDLPPFRLQIGDKLGVFSHGGGTVLWANVAGEKTFYETQLNLISVVKAMKFNVEDRPFVPHITLCRKVVVPGNVNIYATAFPFVEVKINQISLMESEQKHGKLNYKQVHIKKLSSL